MSQSFSSRNIAVWQKSFFYISALRGNFGSIRKGPPDGNKAFLTNSEIPRTKGKFLYHEKWFLTYLAYIQQYTKTIRISTHWFFYFWHPQKMDKSTKLYLWLLCVWLDWILFVIVTKEHLFMGPIKFIELSAHKSKTYQIFRKTKRHFCPLVSVMLREQYWKLNSYLAICNLTIETEWKICENLYCSIISCLDFFLIFEKAIDPVH